MIITEETWRELQSGDGRVERKWVYVIVLVAVVVTAILCIGITYWVTTDLKKGGPAVKNETCDSLTESASNMPN